MVLLPCESIILGSNLPEPAPEALSKAALPTRLGTTAREDLRAR